MSDLSIHASPSLPEREYYVAPRGARGRRRRRRVTAAALAAMLLTGFFLGRATAHAEGPTLLEDKPGSLPIVSLAQAAPTSAVRKEHTVRPPEPSDPALKAPAEPAALHDWRLLLVNYETLLPEGFTVPELTTLKNGCQVDARIYEDLQTMMDAARAAGMDPLICSAYRTGDKQAELYERKVQKLLGQGYDRAEAEPMAAKWVARPGTSEHQTGLALDIVSAAYQLLDEGQAETRTQQWLMDHCAEYGFILRYPSEKSNLTGVGFEPWHYRYVGKTAAEAIMSQGVCLEEYLTA